jgi:hypothetical protein
MNGRDEGKEHQQHDIKRRRIIAWLNGRGKKRGEERRYDNGVP